jgi:hypothetical protein
MPIFSVFFLFIYTQLSSSLQITTGLQHFHTKVDKYWAKDLKIQNQPAFTSFKKPISG